MFDCLFDEKEYRIPSFLRRKAGGRKKAWQSWNMYVGEVPVFLSDLFFLADTYLRQMENFVGLGRYMLGTSLSGLGGEEEELCSRRTEE